jgi:HK97 family phage prohead protease
MSQSLTPANEVYIKGYASVFKCVDQAHDIIREGAFKETINQRSYPIKLLWQHDASNPIGSIIHIKEDNYGLFIKATITNHTQIGREATELIKSGIVSGLSVGIVPKKYATNAKGYNEISEAILYEISVVTFPANLYAKIESIQDNVKTNNLVQLISSAKSLKLSLLTH